MDRHQKFFEESIHIDEILLEASAYGLSGEVESYAKKFMEANPTMDSIEAYQLAYQEWILHGYRLVEINKPKTQI